jgi:hypothetical protein
MRSAPDSVSQAMSDPPGTCMSDPPPCSFRPSVMRCRLPSRNAMRCRARSAVGWFRRLGADPIRSTRRAQRRRRTVGGEGVRRSGLVEVGDAYPPLEIESHTSHRHCAHKARQRHCAAALGLLCHGIRRKVLRCEMIVLVVSLWRNIRFNVVLVSKETEGADRKSSKSALWDI